MTETTAGWGSLVKDETARLLRRRSGRSAGALLISTCPVRVLAAGFALLLGVTGTGLAAPGPDPHPSAANQEPAESAPSPDPFAPAQTREPTPDAPPSVSTGSSNSSSSSSQSTTTVESQPVESQSVESQPAGRPAASTPAGGRATPKPEPKQKPKAAKPQSTPTARSGPTLAAAPSGPASPPEDDSRDLVLGGLGLLTLALASVALLVGLRRAERLGALP